MTKLIFNIAFKFISYKTKGILSFVRKTFYLAIIGLTLSVLSLILLNAIGNGYKNNLKVRLLELESDIEIVSNDLVNTSDFISSIIDITNQELKSYCVYNKAPAIIKFSYLSEGVEIISYTDGECPISVNKGEALLGVELKNKLKINFDNEIAVINPYKLLESIGLNKSPKTLTIKSFLKTDTPDDRYRVIVHKDDFYSLFENNGDYVSRSIKMYLNNSDSQDRIRGTLYNEYIFKDSEIYTFNDKYEKLSKSLNQIFMTISIILCFFIALAILNITSSIWLIIESKKKQIHYLVLAGMKKYQICSIFMIVSILLIIGSFLLGYLLSELIVFIQNNYSIISIPSNVYIISDLKGVLDYKYICLFFIFFIIIGIIFSLIPCYRLIQRKDTYA